MCYQHRGISHGRGGATTMTFDDMLNGYAKYRKVSDFKEAIPRHLYSFYYTSADHFGDISSLTQEMVDEWFQQRKTESKASYHSRIYPIVSFLK